ncbi:DUF742 domain-containing protein [Streptomyces sp. RFCAC02]|uniref:DUF742 domain-containing protein n=1 Tax=Streptomyces sp. RFCAC02 TaxID=2499143 RepID=UPI0010227014|nr:DUF742 domain-containing protein [Streptomyces sp. RFCAC02]
MTPHGRQRRGMVRTHTPTGGRARPSRQTLDLATLLIVQADRDPRGLDPYSHQVMEVCMPGVLSVAEVSAHLRLPGAVTKVLVAALVDDGYLIARDPVPAAAVHDMSLLERILDGLRAL